MKPVYRPSQTVFAPDPERAPRQVAAPVKPRRRSIVVEPKQRRSNDAALHALMRERTSAIR